LEFCDRRPRLRHYRRRANCAGQRRHRWNRRPFPRIGRHSRGNHRRDIALGGARTHSRSASRRAANGQPQQRHEPHERAHLLSGNGTRRRSAFGGCDRSSEPQPFNKALERWAMGDVPKEDRYERMQYRRSGRSGLELPAISLGLWHNFGKDQPFETARAICRRAFDLGITHFDLANNYGPPPGSAEEAFGKILATDFVGYRDQLIISSKAGYRMWPGP